MEQTDGEQVIARLSKIDRELAEPDNALILDRIRGPRSMARLTAANLHAFESHIDQLTDTDFAEILYSNKFGHPYQQFVEQLQHLSANYFLSAVPFLEHLNFHLKKRGLGKDDPTQEQYRLGLNLSVDADGWHEVIKQLRHLVAHRHLPTVRLVRRPEGDPQIMPVIDRRELLDDDRCKGLPRTILTALADDWLDLAALIRNDGRLVLEFADWFFQIEALHNSSESLPLLRLLERRENLVQTLSETLPGSV